MTGPRMSTAATAPTIVFDDHYDDDDDDDDKDSREINQQNG